jgi:hypothetical protein
MLKEMKERFSWLSLGLGLKGLAKILMRQGKKEPWLGRALQEFNGVYKFESGDKGFSRFLVFRDGKVSAPKNFSGEHDFLFTLYDVSRMKLGRKSSDMVLEIVIGNKIGQSGNLYYLYRFGFIMSLLDRSFRRKKIKRSSQVVKPASAS